MADDLGALYTDRQLIDMERKLSRLYTQAGKDIERKLADFTAKMAAKEKVFAQQVKDGKMTQEAFDDWKAGVVFRGKQWTDKMAQISAVLADTNTVATNILRGKEIGVFAMNGNYAAYTFEHGFGVSFGFDLYDEKTVARLLADDPNILPFKKLDKKKDAQWNFKNIRTQITQGIIQGESIPQIAKRLAGVVPDRNKKQMTLHARTAMTSAQNGGRQERYKEAEELGIKFKKVWLATLDGRTRDTHADLDGQAVKPNESFKVAGYTIRFPGDPWARPELVYNCRCTLVTELDDYPSSFNRRVQEDGSIIADQSFRQWEKSKEKEDQQKKGKRLTAFDIRPQINRPKKSDFESEEEYYEAREAYREYKEQYQQERQAVIDAWMNEEKEFKTKDDVKKWAKENGVTITEEFLDNVDPKLFDDILQTESEMFDRFPEVKARQDGFTQWGMRYERDESYFMEANAGLSVSGRYFSSAETAFAQAIDFQMDKYTVAGDGTLKTLVRHEYGHQVDNYIRDKFSTFESTYQDHASGKEQRRREARAKYEHELRDITLKYGSEYSRANYGEAFAEGFAEFTSNPNSEYGAAFKRFFERWYYANPVE